MKRILIALAGYALYRWWTKPEEPRLVEALPPPRTAPQRKSAAR